MAVMTRRGKRIIYLHTLINFQALIIFCGHVTSAYAKYRCSRYNMRSLVIVGDHCDGVFGPKLQKYPPSFILLCSRLQSISNSVPVSVLRFPNSVIE